MGPAVTTVIVVIFNEALPVSPRLLTREVSVVLKGMFRIMNCDNWLQV